jgi:hypothetical protein
VTIDIDLQGTFLLTSAIAQVDNNDSYLLQYRDTNGVYNDWWTISGPVTFGVETRPNPADNTAQQDLADVLATGVRITGVAGTGDSVYAVSELQVFAEPITGEVPEPASIIGAGCGLALLGLIKYSRARQAIK